MNRTKTRKAKGKEQEFFKIGWAEDGGMYSWYADGTALRHYRIGKKTLPIHGSGLLAFPSLKDAQEYDAHTCGSRKVIMRGTGRQIGLCGAKLRLPDSRAKVQATWRGDPCKKKELETALVDGGWKDEIRYNMVALESFTPIEIVHPAIQPTTQPPVIK